MDKLIPFNLATKPWLWYNVATFYSHYILTYIYIHMYTYIYIYLVTDAVTRGLRYGSFVARTVRETKGIQETKKWHFFGSSVISHPGKNRCLLGLPNKNYGENIRYIILYIHVLYIYILYILYIYINQLLSHENLTPLYRKMAQLVRFFYIYFHDGAFSH
jgi:hypothetical protein